jgi:MFS family permease
MAENLLLWRGRERIFRAQGLPSLHDWLRALPTDARCWSVRAASVASEDGFHRSGQADCSLYTATVCSACWRIADRFLGRRRSVLWRMCVAAGNACLAFPPYRPLLRLGMSAIGAGLKPNAGVIVDDSTIRATHGRMQVSIFYMGINTGAFIAPLACGYLGQKVDWHLGFALAAAGMIVGVIQYVAGGKHLGEAGLRPAPFSDAEEARRHTRALRFGLLGVVLATAVLAGLNYTGVINLLQPLSNALSSASGLVHRLLRLVAKTGRRWAAPEAGSRRVLFVASALFSASSSRPAHGKPLCPAQHGPHILASSFLQAGCNRSMPFHHAWRRARWLDEDGTRAVEPDKFV